MCAGMSLLQVLMYPWSCPPSWSVGSRVLASHLSLR
jgi:hypothetical protein